MIEDPKWREQAHKGVPSASKINIPSQDLFFQQKENIW